MLTQLPAWVLMWGLAFSLFALCKGLSLRGCSLPKQPGHLYAYLFGWPGMNAPSFWHRQKSRSMNVAGLGSGFSFFLCGLLLMWIAAQQQALVAGLLAIPSFLWTLHFGLFRILSEIWQAKGFHAPPLMHRPLLAGSLAEFWGIRWNRAFRDLTYRFLFQPLSRCFPGRLALFLSFAVSGLIHELVISLPAGSGYGGPTLYFLLQALGLQLERQPGFRQHPVRKRILTLCVLAMPLPLLVPEAFLTEVLAPCVNLLQPQP